MQRELATVELDVDRLRLRRAGAIRVVLAPSAVRRAST
jgi:hypothetical protein